MALPEIQLATEFISQYRDILVVSSGMFVFGMAFWKKHRDAIVERDTEFGIKKGDNKGPCQFPADHVSELGRECNGDEKIQVHHIKPERYSSRFGIDPQYAENGISLCEASHVGAPGSIHPDTYQAKIKYREGDQGAFKEMGEQRDKKLGNKQTYWNDKFDRQMDSIAVRSSQRADKKKGGRNSWWPQKPDKEETEKK